MREIKFRAYNKEYNTLSGGFLLTDISANGAVVGGEDGYVGDITGRDGEVVVMQFTGLTDRAGKEIYEGDIVELNHPSKLPHWLTHSRFSDKVAVIKWGYAGWDYIYRDLMSPTNSATVGMGDIPHELSSNQRVIGNIYETPELLKEPK